MRKELVTNIVMLTEIFTQLRSQSNTYPYVSEKEVSEYLINKLGFAKKEMLEKTAIQNICFEVSTEVPNLGLKNQRQMLRYQFFETLVKVSIWMYSTKILR